MSEQIASVPPAPPPQRPVAVQSETRSEPGCLVQALWFIFIGWWAGAIVSSLAWFLNVTIIGLPIGLILLNNLPKVLALQNPKRHLKVIEGEDLTHLIERDVPQHSFLVRALFFLLIGWWWSGIWLGLAYLVAVTLILLPLALGMFRLTPAMTTLRRY